MADFGQAITLDTSSYDKFNPPSERLYPYFCDGGKAWKKATPDLLLAEEEYKSPTLTVSTYNVLADSHSLPAHRRYSLLIQNVLSDDARAEILVLQEVTEDFLSHLLAHQGIRETMPFCTHGPPSQKDVEPLPRHGNVVVFSKYLFDWEAIPSNHGHPASLVVKFRQFGASRPLNLIAMHWPRISQDDSIAVMYTEIDRLNSHVNVDNPTILAGTFNIPTSSYTISQAVEQRNNSSQAATDIHRAGKAFDGYLDAWTFVRMETGTIAEDDVGSVFEGEQGATYDPKVNAMAAEPVASAHSMRPQRFDRILVRGEKGSFQVLTCNKFGSITRDSDEDGKTLYASSHWGVRAVLRLGPDPDGRPLVDHGSLTEHLINAQGSLADPAGVMAAMESTHAIPSQRESEDRAAAFQLVKDVVLESPPSAATSQAERSSIRLVIVPTGSYGLGVWTSSSNIDCLCIGSISCQTFFSLATQRLKNASEEGIKFARRRHGQGEMLVLSVKGISFELQYVSSHALAETWPRPLNLPATDATWAVPGQTHSILKDIRNLDYVRRSVPDIEKFQLAHRFIKSWAEKRGVYGYTYLRGIQITILLVRIYKAWASKTAVLSVPDILVTFFSHYARFDWERDVAFDSFFHKNLRFKKSDRYPLAILQYFSQSPDELHTNKGQYAQSLQTLTQELRRADELFSSGGISWLELLGDDGADEFLHSFELYGKIDVQFWGGSLLNGRAFVLAVEKQLPVLLADLSRSLTNYPVRFWPTRWVERTEDNVQQDDKAGHYQGCYLIGLGPSSKFSRARDSDKKGMDETLAIVLEQFERQFRRNKIFKAQTSWIGTSIVKSDELKPLEVDSRDWRVYGLLEDDDSADEDERADQVRPNSLGDGHDTVALSKQKSKPPTNQPRSVIVPKREGAGRFRTAQEVLNRLRWDHTLDSADYVIGYEDRFVGAMEKDLDGWKSEQTDEEFIPQHRILYFKRKSDGVNMWERRTRTDLLFGSG